MGEAARKLEPEGEDNQPRRVDPVERAKRSWGVDPHTGEPVESGSGNKSVYDDEGKKSAREEADDRWGMSPGEIREAEESGAGANQSEETSEKGGKGQNFGFRMEEELGGKLKSVASKGTNRNTMIAGGAGIGVLIVGVVFLLMFLSSMKVIHFGEVLAVAGYSRFNGIMQERTTQNIFDSSLVEGDGTVSARGRTLVDRIKLRNVDLQIAELGREGKLKFQLSDNKLSGVKMGNEVVSLDGITKELGFGDDFASVSEGWSKLKPGNVSKAARVRYEFTKRIQASVGDSLATEPRYLRSRVFGTISEKVGFKFSRWRQAGRDLVGKTPEEARIADAVESVEEVSSDEIKTGIQEIDGTTQQVKNGERLKAYLEKTGGTFDASDYMKQVIEVDTKKAAKIQEASSKVAVGVLLASLACMAHEAFEGVGQIQQNNEDSSSRMGLQLMAARDQTKAGAATSEAYGTAARQLEGADRAPDYQAATNQPISTENVDTPRIQPDIDPGFAENIAKATSPSQLMGGGIGMLTARLPVVGDAQEKFDKAFCGFILSPEGAVIGGAAEIAVVAIASFFSGGGAAAAEQGAGQLAVRGMLTALSQAFFQTAKDLVSIKSAGTLLGVSAYAIGLKFVVSALAGSTFSGAEAGPDYYQRAAVGTSVLQSRQTRSQYGRPLSKEEASGTDSQYIGIIKQKYNNQGVFARYLSAQNPYSLAGTASAVVPGSFNSFFGTLRGFFGQIGRVFNPMSLGKMFSTVMNGTATRAYAADDYDVYHGLTQWGFSPAELDKMRYDPSYSLFNNPNYISESTITRLDGEIGKCFDAAVSQTEVETKSEYKSVCTAERLGTDEAFRYRLYKLDSAIGEFASQDLSGQGTDVSSGGDSGNSNTKSKAVYMIGDSLTVGMSSSIGDKFSAAGMTLVDTPQATVGINVPGSITKLQADANKVKSADTVVVELGTNHCSLSGTATCASTADFEGQIASMVSAIRAINPSANIYWVNIYTTKGPAYNSINQALTNKASSLNYKVIDWAKEAATNSSKYSFDPAMGVHQTTGQGYVNMGAFIVGAIK